VKRAALIVAMLGVLEIAFATQVVPQEHGLVDPGGKVLVTSWLASQLWVNPWLVAVGGLTVIVAVVLAFQRTRA
jgi:hypothetical protein